MEIMMETLCLGNQYRSIIRLLIMSSTIKGLHYTPEYVNKNGVEVIPNLSVAICNLME
jgi:hypothetical protein